MLVLSGGVGRRDSGRVLNDLHEGGWRYQEVPVNIYYSEYSLAKGQSSWNAVKIGLRILVKRAFQ